MLSPDEVEEFRLRTSPTAEGLRNELQYFDCTPGEFKALMDLRDRTKSTKVADLLNRTAATEQARELWGDERAKEFAKVTDMFYVNARRAAENFGVPADRADQAWLITSDARAAADQIAKNTGVPVDERKRQIDSLQAQTDSRLVDALGAQGGAGSQPRPEGDLPFDRGSRSGHENSVLPESDLERGAARCCRLAQCRARIPSLRR